MGFSRQHWSGLPGPPPGDLPDPGIEHGLPALQVDSLLSVTVEAQIWCWAPIKVSSISYHLPAAGLARLSVVVVVFSTPGTAACQASLSSTTSQNLLKFTSVEWVTLSHHLTLCRPPLL